MSDPARERSAGGGAPSPAGPPSAAETRSVYGSPPGERGSVFAPGDLVAARYQVRRFVAQGGMGDVYEADDLELGARVALKTVRPDRALDAKALERFRREIHLARQVTHPNVCRIFDIGHHRIARSGVPPLDVTFL